MTDEARGIFRKRSFLDYFVMYLTSRSAFQVANVGLIWIVYALTHSALDVAIVGIANTVSTVITTLPAGVWVDRTNRLMLLLISNVISVACLVPLSFMTAGYGFSLIFVVAIVIIWAAAGELYRSTSYAVLPDIVHIEELPQANGVTQSGYQIVNSISTVLGGGLIVIAGVALTFIYGVAGYGFAALFSGFLVYRYRRVQPKAESPQKTQRENRRMGREIVEGFRWLFTQRGLLGLSLLALVANFLAGIPMYFLVIYVTGVLKAGAFLYGAILALIAAGSGAGSLIAGRMPGALAYTGKISILLWTALGGGLILLLGLFPSTVVALAAVLGIGLGMGFGMNIWLTSAQNIVPAAMRGRYFAIDGLLSFVGGPPSIAVGGILITLIGVAPAFDMSGALLLVSALIFSFMKSLWMLDGRPKSVSA